MREESDLELFLKGSDSHKLILACWERQIWAIPRESYNPDGHEQFIIPVKEGAHGGADPKIVNEFIRYIRTGGKIETSAVAARYSVAAGCMATRSLRQGRVPFDIPALPDKIKAYFTVTT